MTEKRLPEGGRAWFVRVRSGRWCYEINPASPQGWLLITGYTLFLFGISVLLLEDGAAIEEWLVWGALAASATLLFLVTMLRMSAPAAPGEGRKSCS